MRNLRQLAGNSTVQQIAFILALVNAVLLIFQLFLPDNVVLGMLFINGLVLIASGLCWLFDLI